MVRLRPAAGPAVEVDRQADHIDRGAAALACEIGRHDREQSGTPLGLNPACPGALEIGAASRGRDRVTLEVDADSPTGAAGLYTGMGWTTSYVTESWHRDVPVPPDARDETG